MGFLNIGDDIRAHVEDRVSSWAFGDHVHAELLTASASSVISAKHGVPEPSGEERVA